MKQIYKKIWEMVKPYYEKGRLMDIKHIEWMAEQALVVCEKENIDDSLLLPLVILHDCGYAKTPKDNPFKLNLRKIHMKKGAEIAKEILGKLNYPENKTKKIIRYVFTHDNWAIGDNKIYKKDKILGTFNDLDFIWMATPMGFRDVGEILNKNPKEMLGYLKNNEKLNNRPFSTLTTSKLFNFYLIKIANQL